MGILLAWVKGSRLILFPPFRSSRTPNPSLVRTIYVCGQSGPFGMSVPSPELPRGRLWEWLYSEGVRDRRDDTRVWWWCNLSVPKLTEKYFDRRQFFGRKGAPKHRIRLVRGPSPSRGPCRSHKVLGYGDLRIEESHRPSLYREFLSVCTLSVIP